jgi:hypothetical protein
MFPLGHIGISVGVVFILNKRMFPNQTIDYRLIVLLSLCQDIIDKSIGHILFRGSLDNGRLIAHTLLFSILATLIIYHHVKSQWYLFSTPLWIHFTLDRVWEDAFVLCWPFLGWQFEAKDLDIIERWIEMIIHDPYVLGGEIIGSLILILLCFHCKLYRKDHVKNLFKEGKLLLDRTTL